MGAPVANEDIEAEQAAKSERIRGIAKGWLGQLVEVISTPGEAYLRSRGLEPPYPDCVRFLERTDRTGEGAVVAVLTADDGEPVALQLGYVDGRGAKSTIERPRKLWPMVEDWSECGLLRIRHAARDGPGSPADAEIDPVEALRRAATEAAAAAAGKFYLEEDVALMTRGSRMPCRCVASAIRSTPSPPSATSAKPRRPSPKW